MNVLKSIKYKNKIPFKAVNMNSGYIRALSFINNLNNNLKPEKKIKKWNVKYIDNTVILKF